MTNTPDTDAARLLHFAEPVVPLAFARKLERERDESRFELALAKIPTTVDAVEREEWRQERDALRRKVAAAEGMAEVSERVVNRLLSGIDSLGYMIYPGTEDDDALRALATSLTTWKRADIKQVDTP